MKNSSNEKTYYDRKMDKYFVEKLIKDYPWLISFVKDHECLDFQTVNNPKTKRSRLSIYRGTGRVLTFNFSPNGISWDAGRKYKELCPEFFKMPTKEIFEKYLDKIKEKNVFKRYYNDKENNRNEGYFQNLVGRRYTFQITEKDDFIIIDKEFVLGFENEKIKEKWNENIIKDVEQKIKEFKRLYNGKQPLPQEINNEYGEFDFLALNKEGDILIMELKQNNPSKTALSPIQVYFYYQQFKKLLEEDQGLYKNIIDMVVQKMDMGIISPIFKKKLPVRLSGKIVPCVIIGECKGFSKTMCERYELAKKIFLPEELETYICEKDGSIKKTDNARCIDR